MERALARHVVTRAFRAGEEITALVPLLKAACGEAEYRPLALAIARAAAGIKTEIIDRIYAEHPEIEAEIAREITRYERVL